MEALPVDHLLNTHTRKTVTELRLHPQLSHRQWSRTLSLASLRSKESYHSKRSREYFLLEWMRQGRNSNTWSRTQCIRRHCSMRRSQPESRDSSTSLADHTRETYRRCILQSRSSKPSTNTFSGKCRARPWLPGFYSHLLFALRDLRDNAKAHNLCQACCRWGTRSLP